MSSSSFPIKAESVFVADASVVINLNATGRALDIVRAQPGCVVVTDNAFAELAAGDRNGHSDREKLQVLIDAGAVAVVRLADIGTRIYESLVEGSASRTLDDGEAATIGYAYETGGIAVIDERKARKLCATDYPDLSIASTVDLLMHELVLTRLGPQGQVDAVINALRYARMRVPPHQIESVVHLIGEETAACCNSLPNMKRAAV